MSNKANMNPHYHEFWDFIFVLRPKGEKKFDAFCVLSDPFCVCCRTRYDLMFIPGKCTVSALILFSFQKDKVWDFKQKQKT